MINEAEINTEIEIGTLILEEMKKEELTEKTREEMQTNLTDKEKEISKGKRNTIKMKRISDMLVIKITGEKMREARLSDSIEMKG